MSDALTQARVNGATSISLAIIEAVAQDDPIKAGAIAVRLRSVGLNYNEIAAMFYALCPKCDKDAFEWLMYRADELSDKEGRGDE